MGPTGTIAFAGSILKFIPESKEFEHNPNSSSGFLGQKHPGCVYEQDLLKGE